MLKVIHVTVNVGMSFFGLLDGSRAGVSKLTGMWPSPLFSDLSIAPLYARVDGVEMFAGFILHLWVLLVAAFVAAFVISFYFSGQTVMYYLLRRLVDATDLEDVFVEEEEEEEELPGVEAPTEVDAGAAEAPEPEQAETPEEQEAEEEEAEEEEEEEEEGEEEEEPSEKAKEEAAPKGEKEEKAPSKPKRKKSRKRTKKS
jgi:outer membrane biosynthesis protein TonB